MKKSMFVLAALTAITLVGCGEAQIEKVEQSVENHKEDKAEKAEPKEEKAAPTELKVGESVKVDDLVITLNTARKYAGNEAAFETPMNDQYVILDVAIENTGKEAASVSSLLNFKLVSAEGYEQDLGFIADQKGSLDSELGAGRKLAGEIVFDAAASEYYELIFSNPFTTGEVIWKVKDGEMK